MRIVVVDDAAILRTLFTRIVTAIGHSVVGEAGTLVAAVELARTLAPDAIVLDGRLGGGGLSGSLSALRQAAPRSAVFVVVARDEPALVALAREGGSAGLLRRPYSRAQIRDALSACEMGHGAERA